ncbi:UNKNOWN [Stylonychia lemnae]|uniref:Uncharacterized protein n=1 Tax=Stylonychia lemnae TaxID=5949 RepID=A0A077ZZI4_STYLE|nr:UNKNOWN [Stylonychia lemnae]|eukprot:CDW73928.1 UNKNOWN [Stylonychia lemnae]
MQPLTSLYNVKSIIGLNLKSKIPRLIIQKQAKELQSLKQQREFDEKQFTLQKQLNIKMKNKIQKFKQSEKTLKEENIFLKNKIQEQIQLKSEILSQEKQKYDILGDKMLYHTEQLEKSLQFIFEHYKEKHGEDDANRIQNTPTDILDNEDLVQRINSHSMNKVKEKIQHMDRLSFVQKKGLDLLSYLIGSLKIFQIFFLIIQ